MSRTAAREFVRSDLIPDHPPDPALQAEVRAILGLDKKRPPPPALSDSLPDGMSDPGIPPPPLKMPEPLPLPPERPADEVAPAFSAVTRVTQANVNEMPWLVGRLCEKFPHIAAAHWPGRLAAMMRDNSYLFLKTANAVVLATTGRDTFGGPWVEMLFAFHIDRGTEGGNIQASPGEKDTVQLFREVMRWGKTLGATEVRRAAVVCDLSPGRVIALLPADRREDIVVRIR